MLMESNHGGRANEERHFFRNLFHLFLLALACTMSEFVPARACAGPPPKHLPFSGFVLSLLGVDLVILGIGSRCPAIVLG